MISWICEIVCDGCKNSMALSRVMLAGGQMQVQNPPGWRGTTDNQLHCPKCSRRSLVTSASLSDSILAGHKG